MNRAGVDWRWWVWHECRLASREAQLGFGPIAVFLGAGVLAAAYLMMHAVAFFLLEYLAGNSPDAYVRFDGLLLVLLFLASWVRGIGISQRMLYGRGDARLLLCSPARIADVLRARALVLAFASVAFPLLALSPIANVSLLLGRAGMLAFYPMAFSCAVVASFLAVAVSACSRRWLGKGAAKVVARGGTTLLLLLALASRLPALAAPMELAGARLQGAATWLGTALAGNPAPLCASLAASLLAAGLLPRLLAAVYLSGMGDRPSTARGTMARRRHGLRASNRLTRLLLTHCKLAWRRPSQLAQAGLSALLVTAAVIAIGRHVPLPTERLSHAALVFALGAFGSEVGLLMSCDQVPWLLASAPLTRRTQWMVRCLSAHLLALPMLLVLLAGLTIYRPAWTAIVLVFGSGALSTSLLLATSAPSAGTPGGPHGPRNWLLSGAGMACCGLWAAAAATLHGSMFSATCLALAAMATGAIAATGFHLHAAGVGKCRPRAA